MDSERLKGGAPEAGGVAGERPEFLNAILAHMHDALFVNKGERIAFVNQACLELFGAGRAEDLIGRSPFELFHTDDHPKIAERIRNMREGEPVPTIEERIIRLDGAPVQVEVTAGSFLFEGEAAIVVMLRDITARQATERQLQHAQRLEAVGQLTGGLAHDFNNLLAIVIGNLDLLEEQLAGWPAQLECVGEAQAAALRGAELTKQLLAFARRQPLAPQTVDLNELISGMVELCRRTLGEAIEVRLNLADDLWLTKVDPAQLESAILNLVINARDAMASGGALTIETKNMCLEEGDEIEGLDPGSYSVVSVSDSGHGMDAETASRVFEPFFTTKSAGEGSGLGLSMVYGFAQQSGGQVRIYSERGHGTIVRLFLPRASGSGDEQPLEPRRAELQKAAGETVLLVEDNEGVRRIVERQLKGLGYRVLEAGTGSEALEILRANEGVDLLFTDVVMPGGMDGLELGQAARAKYPGLKILYTSGFTQWGERGRVKLENIGSVLTKPYRKADLAAKLREVLDGSDPARPDGER